VGFEIGGKEFAKCLGCGGHGVTTSSALAAMRPPVIMGAASSWRNILNVRSVVMVFVSVVVVVWVVPVPRLIRGD
jgi:tryptophan synthase beta subunit